MAATREGAKSLANVSSETAMNEALVITSQESGQDRKHLIVNSIKKVAAVAAVTGALTMIAAQPAEAAVLSGGGGRVTIYLSQSETQAIGQGWVPAPPLAIDWRLKTAYYGLAHGHKWFAQQYASRGWCSGFRLSIYPWETQGYFGYACNWR